MGMTIELKLHKDCQFHLLDPMDVYNYIGECTDRELKLAQYVSIWCEYLNHPLFQNPEFAYADAEYARLGGWLTGFNAAMCIKIDEDSDMIRIKYGRDRIILHRPYADKIDKEEN